MDASFAIDAAHRALVLVLLLSLPAVVTAAVIGLGIAVLQAATQIQDQSVSQALRLVAIIGVLLLTARWCASEIFHFADLLLAGVGLGSVRGS
jgi:type III secretion protein S